MADEPHFDEHGRGPLTREFHRRCGFDPMDSMAGFKSFAAAIDRARGHGHEFPEQFREMLRVAVDVILEERLKAFREAYTRLLRRVERLEQRAAPRQAPNQNGRQPVTPSLRGPSDTAPAGAV